MALEEKRLSELSVGEHALKHESWGEWLPDEIEVVEQRGNKTKCKPVSDATEEIVFELLARTIVNVSVG